MSAVALVKDPQFPNHYHTIIVNHQKFEKVAIKTDKTLKSMNGAWICGTIGGTLTITGGIWLISGIANNNIDSESILLTVAGLVVDVVSCCLCCFSN